MVSPEQKAWADRKAPPVTVLWMASIALIAAGVSYLAAYLPKHAPLGPAVGLLVAAALVLLAGVILLARMRDFAWSRFWPVWAWTLLAYVVIGGTIEYAFVYDQTRGQVLAVMTLMLAVFVLAPPLLVGFTVARFQRDERAA
jgi:drug/metabolite transporter (DMT)-like permease